MGSLLRCAWFAFCLLGMVSVAPGQGWVIFANASSTAINTNSATTSGTRGKTAGAAGGFYYALFTAPAGTTNNDLTSGLWNFTGLYATNTSLAGRLSGGMPGATLTNWPAGTSNAFMIAGWSSNLGHDWAVVYNELTSYSVGEGFFGLSAIGSGIAGPTNGAAFPLFGSGPTSQGVPLTSGFDLYEILWGFVVLALPGFQSVAVNQTATFTLSIYSFGPINYQWYYPYGSSGGIANGGTFTIPSAKLSDEGTYNVVATAGGAFLEEVASLTVIGPPTISLGIYSNGMYPGITIHGASGWTYAIQSTTNLLSSNSWLTITNLTVTQPVTLWQDMSVNLTVGAGVPPQQYYRVGLVP